MIQCAILSEFGLNFGTVVVAARLSEQIVFCLCPCSGLRWTFGPSGLGSDSAGVYAVLQMWRDGWHRTYRNSSTLQTKRRLLTQFFLLQQGEIYVNEGQCRIIQRHLIFNGGIAYGIDCLLTPPSLGGRCDKQTAFHLTVNRTDHWSD